MKLQACLIIIVASALLIGLGCSSPLSPDTGSSPLSVSGGDPISGTGLMGAYSMVIDPGTMSAELTPLRVNSIGESYIVSGTGFFTSVPCANCLNISALGLNADGDFAVTYNVRHPFEKGDVGQPPTAANRLDLDVFDLALQIEPVGVTPHTFPRNFEKVYTDIIANADGYTLDLFDVLVDDAAMPYVLVIDEAEMDPVPSPTTYNVFEMGANADFEVAFKLTPGGPAITYNVYLTMGYGASAKKAQRLAPKYYNPEFNRKAAWKVDVTTPEGDDPPDNTNTWLSNDASTFMDVVIEVYDWQIGATAYAGTDYENAPENEVFAESVIFQLRLEIDGMLNDWKTAGAPFDPLATGMPGDPYVYYIPVQNENMSPAGEYLGLVTIDDTRLIGDPGLGDVRDYLIDSPDGIQLYNYVIPAYRTYQVFTATVVDP